MKFKRYLLVLTLSVVSIMLFSSSNVQASSWQNSTPKSLRGNYRDKMRIASTYGIDGKIKEKFQNRLCVTKRGFFFCEYDYNLHGKYVNNGTNLGILRNARSIKLKKNFYKIRGWSSICDSSCKTTYYVRIYRGHKLRFSMNKSLKDSRMFYRVK